MQAAQRMVVVPGDQIDLVALEREDVPRMAPWFSDLQITALLGQPGTFGRLEDEQAWYDGLDKRTDQIVFGIVVRSSGTLIGTVGLIHINHQGGTAELGITIGDKQAWNHGYGSEAVRLTAEYGCFFQGLVSVCLWHVSYNERGHRAYLKAGFRDAGRWRDAYTIGAQRFDKIMMDVTRDELDLARMRALAGLLPDQR